MKHEGRKRKMKGADVVFDFFTEKLSYTLNSHVIHDFTLLSGFWNTLIMLNYHVQSPVPLSILHQDSQSQAPVMKQGQCRWSSPFHISVTRNQGLINKYPQNPFLSPWRKSHVPENPPPTIQQKLSQNLVHETKF